jgi:hypothetical protein
MVCIKKLLEFTILNHSIPEKNCSRGVKIRVGRVTRNENTFFRPKQNGERSRAILALLYILVIGKKKEEMDFLNFKVGSPRNSLLAKVTVKH